MIRRGDVVVAAFPYAGGGGSKNRPAVVVQSADRARPRRFLQGNRHFKYFKARAARFREQKKP